MKHITTLAQACAINDILGRFAQENLALSAKEQFELEKKVQSKLWTSREIWGRERALSSWDFPVHESRGRLGAEASATSSNNSYTQWWEKRWEEQEKLFPGASCLLSDRALRLLLNRAELIEQQRLSAMRELERANRQAAIAVRIAARKKVAERKAREVRKNEIINDFLSQL